MSWFFGDKNKDAEISALRGRVDELERRLAAIEKTVGIKQSSSQSSSEGSRQPSRQPSKKVSVDVFLGNSSAFGEFRNKYLSGDVEFQLHRYEDAAQTSGQVAVLVVFSPSDRWVDSLSSTPAEDIKGMFSSILACELLQLLIFLYRQILQGHLIA